MSRRLSWTQASLPAAVALAAVGAALGLAIAGTWGFALCGLLSLLVFEWIWFRRALPRTEQLLSYWQGVDSPLLQRSWSRAFDEVRIVSPKPPRLVVSATAGDAVMLWKVRSGESVLILGQTWLQLHAESELRALLRESASARNSPEIWLRSARAWFSIRISTSVSGPALALGLGRSGAPALSPVQVLLALPGVAWFLWVHRAEPQPPMEMGAARPWLQRLALWQTAMSRNVTAHQ